MADSPALRAKRARRHKAGDHSICRSETCDAAATAERDECEAVTSRVTSPVTDGPGRGARLWAQMGEGRGLAPTHVVLLEEACRIADRLDRLDAMLLDPARAWLRFDVSDDGAEITVVVDKLLSEARMQETTLKNVVQELRQALDGEGAVQPPAATPGTTSPAGGGGSLVDLRARVATKRAALTPG